MKRFLLVAAALVALAVSVTAVVVMTKSSAQTTISDVAIIPQPLSVVKHDNNFTVSTSTTIVYDAQELKPIADYVLSI